MARYPSLTSATTEHMFAMLVRPVFATLHEDITLRDGPLPALIKYIGNKRRYAKSIIENFPNHKQQYIEPFFGSGAVLGALKPKTSIAIDAHAPLIEMWRLVQSNPLPLVEYYSEIWQRYSKSDKEKKMVYKEVVDRYNNEPNPFDFLFISRSCYGGVLRYRKADGFLSTPVGSHHAISPDSFKKRAAIWHQVVKNTHFICGDFALADEFISSDSLIYCDPPYTDSQKILYGAQDFSLPRLIEILRKWKDKEAYIALSIDGVRHSGRKGAVFEYDKSLFRGEILIDAGGSMLKRFQLKSDNTIAHQVKERLLVSDIASDTAIEHQSFLPLK